MLPHVILVGTGQTVFMWLLSLVLAGGLGTPPVPSPERLLYPTRAERIQICRTPKTPTTEAALRAARQRAGQRQVWFTHLLRCCEGLALGATRSIQHSSGLPRNSMRG